MFGKEMRCPECNQYIPDRCTCNEWQSNVQWDIKHYLGEYGDGVSTDKHRNFPLQPAMLLSLFHPRHQLMRQIKVPI